MIGESRKSSTNSWPTAVAASPATRWLSQAEAEADGVAALPSPVCQMPAPRFWNPAARSESAMAVGKPQTPPRTHSQVGLEVVVPARLKGERKVVNPPLLASKLNGALSPALGDVVARMPRSSTPLGMKSTSVG